MFKKAGVATAQGIQNFINLNLAHKANTSTITLVSKPIFVILMLCLLLTACSFDRTDEKATSESIAPSTMRSSYPALGFFGGERRMGNTALPNSFNPYLASDAASLTVIYQMFSGLTIYDAHRRQLVPGLAKTWERNTEGTLYTLTLRSGLKWSDGKPLTAADVVFTYNEIINNPLIPNNYRDFWSYQKHFPKIRALNAEQIQFELDKPFAPFLFNLMAPIVPAHVFKSLIKPNAQGKLPFLSAWTLDVEPEALVVNGPWKLKTYKPGERVVLEKNPYYYGKDAKQRQLPYLDQMVLTDVQSNQGALLRFRQGDLDTYIMRAADYDLLAPEQKKGNFTVYNLGPTPSSLFVMLNQSLARDKQGKPLVNPIKSKWFRNLKFRKALAWSMNKEGLIDSVYKGRAVPQYVHLNQHNPYFHTELTDYPYDMDGARKLLKEAGFYLEKEQLYDSEGNPVRFTLSTNAANIERDATCSLLRRQWGELGIHIDYRPVTFSVLVQKMHDTYQWDAMLVGLASNSLEPHFSSSRWKLDGRMHLFNMGNTATFGERATTYEPWEKEMQQLYKQAAGALSDTQRQTLYKKAQALEYANLPYLYTVSEMNLVAINNRLGNIMPSIYGGSGLHQVNWNSAYHYIRPNQN